MLKINKIWLFCLIGLIVTACSISYKFNGASIDYTKVKTIRVRYSNRVNPDEDFEQSFSAYREFDATQMLQQVQDQLSEEIIDELVDQIYNATVANW